MSDTRILTPIKAIRAKCMDCMCDSHVEIKLCPITDCSLYPYRFGTNPNIKREYTEEQKQAMTAHLRKNNATFTGENSQNA